MASISAKRWPIQMFYDVKGWWNKSLHQHVRFLYTSSNTIMASRTSSRRYSKSFKQILEMWIRIWFWTDLSLVNFTHFFFANKLINSYWVWCEKLGLLNYQAEVWLKIIGVLILELWNHLSQDRECFHHSPLP